MEAWLPGFTKKQEKELENSLVCCLITFLDGT